MTRTLFSPPSDDEAAAEAVSARPGMMAVAPRRSSIRRGGMMSIAGGPSLFEDGGGEQGGTNTNANNGSTNSDAAAVAEEKKDEGSRQRRRSMLQRQGSRRDSLGGSAGGGSGSGRNLNTSDRSLGASSGGSASSYKLPHNGGGGPFAGQGGSTRNLLGASGRSLNLNNASFRSLNASFRSLNSAGSRPGMGSRSGQSRRLVTRDPSVRNNQPVPTKAMSKAKSRRDILESVDVSTSSAKLRSKIRFSIASGSNDNDSDDSLSLTDTHGDGPPLDLHEACTSCPSLAQLRNTLNECSEDGHIPCATPRQSDGKLPLHCIGLNRDLILHSTGGTAASVNRVDQFIIRELIVAYPVSVVEEDDHGRIPFTEVIIDWIEARRAVRLLEGAIKREKQRKSRISNLTASFVQKCKKRMSVLAVCEDSDEDRDQDLGGYALVHDDREEEEDGVNQLETSYEESKGRYNSAQKRLSELSDDEIEFDDDDGDEDEDEVHDLPALVEWSLRLLSHVIDQPKAAGQLGCAGSNLQMQRDMHVSNSDSIGMDNGGDNEKGRGSISSKNTSMNLGALYSEVIVEKMAEIPHFVEELLLIEDRSARARIFDLSIVHKILFCQESLGDGRWLIAMMDRGIRSGSGGRGAGGAAAGKEEQRETCVYAESAIFYLESISTLSLQDDLHFSSAVKRNSATKDMISGSDVRHYRKKRAGLFEVVGSIPGMMRTLCGLEGNLVSRSAVTACVQHELDRKIFSPFSMTVALSDGLFHLLLIIAFRLGPARHLFHLSPDDASFRPHQYLISNMVLMICVVYFGLKETQLAFAKYNLSRRLFWSDLFGFWTILDIVPLIMVSLCSIAVDFTIRWRVLESSAEEAAGGSSDTFEPLECVEEDDTIPFQLRVLVATITPFLWLRVLGHVKMWNKQLATFVLCSVEIMKDIKWFLLVLMVAMASFAQMFVSLTCEAKGDGDHYTNFSIEGYVKAYTIMLGDIDNLYIESHPVITLLFIMYTFGVTIVLLNVLIAIVSESYSRSIVSSNLMLGKARLMFVSEMSSLKNFHQLYKTGQTGNVRRNAVLMSIAYGLFITKRFDGTTQLKLSFLGRTFNTGALGISRLDIEASFVFLLLAAFVLAVRVLMAHIHNTFDNNKGVVAESEEKEKRPPWVRTVDSVIEQFIVFVRKNLDTLTDGDDRELIGGAPGAAPAGSAFHVNGAGMNKLYQALAANNKAVKVEMMNSSEDMQHALQDTEDHLQMDMTKLEVRLDASLTENEERVTESVSAMIAASEERILRAIRIQMRNEDES